VLVVDDHPINLLVLSRQVRALGYAQESATNGLEALAKWKSGRFSLIITDCNMPEMDGYDLTRSIRRLELENGGGHIPVIAFTANALGGVAEECLDAGMDDVLVKPVELSQILKKLDKWLPIPAAAASAEGSAMGRVTPHAPATPLDSSALAAFTGGDPALEFDTLRSYRRANQEDAATLKRALADADLLLVTHASHRMLGASRIVGARSFADVCERIGIASRAGDWPAIHAEMRDFEQEWSRLDDWLGALA
jgi:CheY-like chemotaxis protein/HPt (histidine-containing phosphotransfer) domain-containing protein